MAFNGLALYSTGQFSGVKEDVSDIISMVSPYETPLLDILSQPEREASNILHEWVEESLRPTKILLAAGYAAADLTFAVSSYAARNLKPGSILEHEASQEKLVVTVVTGTSTITVVRQYAGTTAPTSYTSGTALYHIADAGQEGDDVTSDVSRPRVRKFNRVQLFKTDVIVSGTMQAVSRFGVADEFEHQVQNRVREAIRNLEKSVIRSVSSDANSLGGSGAVGEYRTLGGLWASIATNVTSIATMTETVLGNSLQAAWDNGGTDIDVILCDINYKRIIDSWNNTRVRVMQGSGEEARYSSGKVTEYDSAFGVQRVMLSRWMRPNTLMCLSSRRVSVVPLQSRSFHFEEIAKTGDARKGFVVGEYTIETKNEEAMSKVNS